jgi:hypothetical protein
VCCEGDRKGEECLYNEPAGDRDRYWESLSFIDLCRKKELRGKGKRGATRSIGGPRVCLCLITGREGSMYRWAACPPCLVIIRYVTTRHLPRAQGSGAIYIYIYIYIYKKNNF